MTEAERLLDELIKAKGEGSGDAALALEEVRKALEERLKAVKPDKK